MLFFLPCYKSFGEGMIEYSYVAKGTTEEGEYIALESTRGPSNFRYRVVKGDKAIEVDLRRLHTHESAFFETSSYYLFYGSIGDWIDMSKTTPFIIAVTKDLSKVKYYFNDKSTLADYILEIREFPANNFLMIEVENRTFYFGTPFGDHNLYYLDEDLNVLTPGVLCGTQYCTFKIVYDVIKVSGLYNNDSYFTKDLVPCETYEKELYREGNFELPMKLKVNGTTYPIGTSFNMPGSYILDDGENEPQIMHLDAKITGVEEGATYNDYVEYQSSGGYVFLNEEIVYLNGLIKDPGHYTLKVKGMDDYEKSVSFTIEPKFITKMEDGGFKKIGDEIKFTGYIKVNDGEYIKGSYVIKEPGSYKVSLFLSKEDPPVNTICFTVLETEAKETVKIWVYFVEDLVTLSLISAIILVLYKRKEKKKIKRI